MWITWVYLEVCHKENPLIQKINKSDSLTQIKVILWTIWHDIDTDFFQALYLPFARRSFNAKYNMECNL